MVLNNRTQKFYIFRFDVKEFGNSKTVVNAENQTRVIGSKQNDVDTRYEDLDSNSGHVIIENSYPRGGLKYDDPKGEEYVYAVFWTRITNESEFFLIQQNLR